MDKVGSHHKLTAGEGVLVKAAAPATREVITASFILIICVLRREQNLKMVR